MPKDTPRGVDWPTLVGRDLGTPRTQVGGAGTVSVLSAADELSSYRDLDTVYRRAVELGRDRIGLERVSLFLYDSSSERLVGTWGTGVAGETTDEHHIYFTAGFHHREATAQAIAGISRWMVFQDVPLTVQVDGEPRVVGIGWNAVTPILGRAGPIGLLANDAARSGSALDESKQVQTAIFCRLLGSIIEDLRRGAEELPWKSLLASLPRVGEDNRQSLVISIVHALHRDPTLTGQALAKRLGASGPRLAQTFAAEMGMSLVEYKNRLRIERFFSLVAPGGGNLLQAALDAGFGSYAQFHRVFRELVGAAPKEYLTGRN
ncbi:MAG TPA: AraC family transcriptional regulator [Polyangiaceae bacterium]|nr:AraC family transcriptional regulator [Polyangiaceae bacterium]